MSEAGAFGGEASIKHALLADLKAIGPITEAWISRGIDGTGSAVIAREQGLHPAFVHVVNAMTGDPRDTDVQQFVTGVIEATAPGTKTANIVRRWFLWSWDDAVPSLQDRLRGTKAFDAAQALMALVRTSLVDPVDAMTWRAARAALSRCQELSSDQADAAEIVLAMGWDLTSVPGSASDVVDAWQAGIRRWTLRAHNWTDAMEQELIDFGFAVHDQAMAALGEPTEENKEEFLVSYKGLTQKIRTDSDMQPKIEHNNTARHFANEARWEWRDIAREAMITCASSESEPVLDRAA